MANRYVTLLLVATWCMACVSCDRQAPPDPTQPANENVVARQATPSKTTAANPPQIQVTPAPDPIDDNAPAIVKVNTATLAGSWFNDTNTNPTGMEFHPDQQVLLTKLVHPDQREIQSDIRPYDILHDGSLVILSLAGKAEFFKTTLTPNTMTLVAADGKSQVYKRLPAITSIKDAFNQKWEASDNAFKARQIALEKFISTPGLLLRVTTTDHPDADQLIALDPGSGVQKHYNAKAWFDSAVPAAANAILSVNHFPAKNISTITLIISGRGQSSANQQSSTPHAFTLKVTGDADQLNITSIPDNNQSATLIHDPVRHDVIVKKYQEEMARRQTLATTITQTIKDFAVLKGQSQIAGDETSAMSQDTILLLRDPTSSKPTWQGEIRINPPNAPPKTLRFANASIEIQQARPTLVIPAGRVTYTYRLDGEFIGQWSSTSHPTQYASRMQLAQAMSLDDYQANLTDLREKMKSITPQMTFAGFVPAANQPNTAAQITPVTLKLTITPDGLITAAAYYSLYRTNVSFEGKLVQNIDGPTLILQFKDIPASQNNARIPPALLRHKLGQQQWSLQLADAGPVLQLKDSILDDNGNSLTFNLVDDTWKTKRTALLNQLLQPGSAMQITWPLSHDTIHSPNSQMSLKIDPATGVITGQYHGKASAALYPHATSAPAAIRGRITQTDLWPGVTLELTTSLNRYTLELILLELNNHPILNGVSYSMQAPQAETYIQLEKVTPEKVSQ